MAINTIYIDAAVMKRASEIYGSQTPKNLRLDNFFQPLVFNLLQKKLKSARYSIKFHPYKYKYSIASIKEIDSFVNGFYFKRIIEQVLSIKNPKIKYEIRKFGPGNYTLLHDAEKEKKGIDFVIDFSDKGKSYGGHTIYLNEAEELLQLNPCPNTLSFIERAKKVMKYTKYVDHRQKAPFVFVAGTIQD